MPKHSAPILFLILLCTGCLVAQQRALTHADYDDWQALRGTAYSFDGAWVAYQIEPQWGDGELVVRQTNGDTTYRYPRGTGARFSANGRFVAFTLDESKVAARDKKIEELRQKAKQQSEGGAAEVAGQGRGSGGSAAATAAAARRRGAGAAGGRRGAGGGGRFGRGGGGDSASGSGDLQLLDLATGKVESIGKVRRWLLSDDVNFLMYQKQGDSSNDEQGDAESGSEEQPQTGGRSSNRRGGRSPSSEPEPAATEPAATEPAATEPAASEPAATEPTASEPGESSAAGSRGSARRRGGRTGRPETPSDPLEQKRPAGYELTVRDLQHGKERAVADVVQFGLSRRGKWLWLHTSAKKPAKDQSYGLFLQAPAGGEMKRLLDGIANVANVTMDRDEQVVAFTSDQQDFAADKPLSDLYLWEGGSDGARRIAYSGANGMPAKKRVGGGVSFSRDGSVLTFSVQDPPEPEPLPILPEDKVDLDIWNWRDGLLQTMQAKGRGRGDSLTAVWHRGASKLLVLGDERTPSLRFVGPDGQRMIGTDSDPYEQEVQWDGRYSDVWLVDARDGTRTKVFEKLRTNVTNSPGGRYLIWFDENYHWWTMDTGTGVRRDLTGSLAVPFHRHDDDHPEPDSAYGIAGWTENDGAVLLYDEFDVWKVSPASGQAVCITDGYGREHHLELRLQRLPRAADDEDPWVDQELLLAAKDVETMAEGFFADALHRTQKPVKLLLVDKAIGGLTSPPDSGRMFFTQSTFAEFPDLWTSKADFSDMRRLSDANPRQAEFRWGKAELVHWVDGDGQNRKGVLVKPDGFDPKKQYPMMVYFYEKLSDRLHSYVTPQPGTSPNASYYVSNGYLWFQPDIVYEEGYPGPSCVKCIASGVQHLIAQGFVDRNAIGAAGHSWGGYQTAYLVTQTNIFKAVESGAPVSNMLSAYGGIRYDSGMSRQFQYEQSQSRIGGTPWQYPLRYQVNSPIHFADKVQTPVLMLHNDADGAVPWTQGIEYFVALKRLGKEAYLFNYNGEPHGLRKRQNQKDWTRRMSEYFDHHLKGAPAPDWMTEGVPYAERDTEKLPFAQSYIDAHIKPAKEKPEAAEAEMTSSPAGSSSANESAAAESATAEPAQQVAPSATAPVEPAAPTGAATSTATSAVTTGTATGTVVQARQIALDRAAQATALVVGQTAPAFTQFDEAGVEHQLADYHGRKLLVWFYPKADTPGCTTQGCGLRDAFAILDRNGVAVLGVSFDDDKANTAFRTKHDFPFPLLCDTERTMGIAYGAAAEKSSRAARRIAFLIGADGKIVQVWNRVDVQSFAADVLTAVSL